MLSLERKFCSVEVCAGAGGQALGLEMAGFDHSALVEIDAHACATLRLNRPAWHVFEQDLHTFSGKPFSGVDLFAGGVPCPPFSIAGKQLGAADERDLFPQAIRLVEEISPKAVLLENVPGLAKEKFSAYRQTILNKLCGLGYSADWQLINACDYGVPQLRPRFLLVALKHEYAAFFKWPTPTGVAPTVGETLFDLLAVDGWSGAAKWKAKANKIAPTVVGGSKKHGGPDLGPTRARRQWAELGVDGLGIANEPPGADYPVEKMPRLTLRMVARIQGFPDSWTFSGKKTASYRQVGNAFPPPAAHQVGEAIRRALMKKPIEKSIGQMSLFNGCGLVAMPLVRRKTPSLVTD
jgi:DNA (cytosine-5)-methyltransferase 1